MKKNYIIAAFIILVVCIFFVVYYMNKPSELTNIETDTSSNVSSLKPVSEKSIQQTENIKKDVSRKITQEKVNTKASIQKTSHIIQVTSSTEELIRVHGVVISDSEKTIKGALLSAATFDIGNRRMLGKKEADTTSDSNGKYELFVPKGNNYLISVKAEGYTTSQNMVLGNRIRNNEAEINFRLSEESVISGIVKDENGKPVEGALVSPFYNMESERNRRNGRRDDRRGNRMEGRMGGGTGEGMPGMMPGMMPGGFADVMSRMIPPDFLAVKTDIEGKFVIHGLNDGIYTLSATKDGYSPALKKDVPAPSSNVEIIIKKGEGCVIAGTVYLASTGEPVEAAAISVTSIPFMMNPVEVKSANDGTFKISGLIPGEFSISATKDEMQSMYHPMIDLRENTTKLDVVLKLFNGYTISGKVFEQDGLKTIPQVKIICRENFRGEGKTAISDEEGAYSISGIFASRVTVSGELEGYFQIGRSGMGGAIQLRMPEDKSEVKNVDITMMRGVKIAGKVESLGDGTPIAGATIQFNTDTTTRDFRRQSTVSDAEGNFSGFVVSNTRLVLTASHEKYADSTTNPIQVMDEPIQDVVIKMGKGGNILGVVLNPDDDPVPNANVTGMAQGPSAGDRNARFGGGRVVTDAEGKFKIEMAPAGEYNLSASASDYDVSNRVVVNITEGKDVEDVKLILKSPHFIEGIVKQSSGDVAVGARVNATRTEGNNRGYRQRSTYTDDKGKFQFDNLSTGKYTLQAENGGLRSKSVEIAVDSSGVELILDLDEATLTGSVIDVSTKKPVENFTIRAAGRGRVYGTFNNSDGSFEIQGLIRGNTYSFLIDAEGYISTTTPDIKIPLNDNPPPVVFEIGYGGSIFGTVKFSENKNPVKGAKVVRTIQTGAGPRIGFEQIAFTDKDGCFLFENQSPAEYIIKVLYGKYPEVSVNCKVVNNGISDVGTMFLVNGGNIIGTVFDSSPQPLPVGGKIVRLRSVKLASPLEMTYRTADDGKFYFENLPKGQYTLQPSGNDYGEKTATAKSGQTVTVNFYPKKN